MRTTAFSILFLTVLAPTFQNVESTETTEDLVNYEFQIPTTIPPPVIEKEIGRRNNGMMMNMSASVGNGNGGKNKKEILDMLLTIVHIYESMVTISMKLFQPIMDFKTFSLSAINTLVNVGNFIMMVMAKKNNNYKTGGSVEHLFGSAWNAENKIEMPFVSAYKPTYLTHYPTYLHKYNLKS